MNASGAVPTEVRGPPGPQLNLGPGPNADVDVRAP